MRSILSASFILSTSLLIAHEAVAYIGPGAGVSAIGSLLALVGALLFAIIGFVWYPIKRLFRWYKAVRVNRETAVNAHTDK